MGLVISIMLHFAMGGLCAYRARVFLEARQERMGLPFVMALAAAALVGGPASVYTFRFHGAYFMHGFWDPVAWEGWERWGFLLSVGVLAVALLAATAGWLAVRYASDRMNPPWCAAPAGGAALVALIFSAVRWRHVWLVDVPGVGSQEPLWVSPLGALVLGFGVAAGLAAMAEDKWFQEERNASMPPAPGGEPLA